MANLRFKRGGVYWVNLDPTIGSEIKKRQPAVVISNDVANRYLDYFQIIPLTSSVKKVYPSEALVTVKGQKAKAMCDQIRTVSKKRFGPEICQLTNSEIARLELALKLHLGLS